MSTDLYSELSSIKSEVVTIRSDVASLKMSSAKRDLSESDCYMAGVDICVSDQSYIPPSGIRKKGINKLYAMYGDCDARSWVIENPTWLREDGTEFSICSSMCSVFSDPSVGMYRVICGEFSNDESKPGTFYMAKGNDCVTVAFVPEGSESGLSALGSFDTAVKLGTIESGHAEPTMYIEGAITPGGGGGSVTVEKIRPLTIRKFEIEETKDDGSIVVTAKWGLYLPENCASILWRDEIETTRLLFDLFWVEKADPGSYVPGTEDWLDITASLQEIASKGYKYISASLSLEGSSSRTCVLSIVAADSADIKSYNTGDGLTGIGYTVPIAKISINSDGNTAVSQFRYGPLFETVSIEGSHLMERDRNPASQNISEWSITQDGAELSEDKTYALIGQIYTRLKVFTETGDEVTSSARRHEKDWIDIYNMLYIRPLVFTNFGAQIK